MGSRNPSTSFCAMKPTWCGSSIASMSTMNSSPPRRATVSASRTNPFKRFDAALSTLSPTACPRLSLISLKQSRSMKISAAFLPVRCELAIACFRRSRNIQRVCQPRQRVVAGQVIDVALAFIQLGQVGFYLSLHIAETPSKHTQFVFSFQRQIDRDMIVGESLGRPRHHVQRTGHGAGYQRRKNDRQDAEEKDHLNDVYP